MTVCFKIKQHENSLVLSVARGDCKFFFEVVIAVII